MEPRFGRDFSAVRVHSGAAAERSAREMDAHAYTVGGHIVFGPGRLAPGTEEGRRLLAHELTHVAQQSGAAGPGPSRAPSLLQRQAAGGDPEWHQSFPGCTAEQSRRLDSLLPLAEALVIGSIEDLENELVPSHSGIITSARSALLRNFHTEDPKDIRTILSSFRKILARLEMGPRNIRCMDNARCDAVCEGRGPPYACAGPGTPITVCSGVFDASTDPFYVVILIHEAAHQVGMPLHTYDPAHRKAVPDERRLALLSANSYANFAEDRALGGTGGYNFHRR